MAANDVFMDTAGFLALWDAADFLRTVAASEALQIQWVGPERFQAAASLFARRHDKGWSFTDCVSFELMHELRIRDSFTTDRHFRQAGLNPLLEKPT